MDTSKPQPVNRTAVPPKSSPPSSLIVEGGAMRGVFTTGVLDGFLEAGFNPFDRFVGVSSGAGNLAAFLAQMPARNLKIYTDYSLRPEFIRWRRFFQGGHLLDLDWLWRITIDEIRLDLVEIYRNGRPLIVCLTDVRSGAAVYKKTNMENLENVLKASSAMPLLYRTFPIVNGRPAVDGGIADPLPVAAEIRKGSRCIMVIRTRPRNYQKKERLVQSMMQWKLNQYPLLRNTIATRVQRYNDALSLIRKPPEGISIVEVCPPDHIRFGRFTRNKEKLMEGYHQGKKQADGAIRAWETIMSDCKNKENACHDECKRISRKSA